ncbi:hypothetical protein NLM24_01460 [Nocardia zapadnayensis]|uniref:hypothetical protein n=1 Tax=Nocardia rhamnosiphila TaxID=426716 RepID=UPI0022452866|nr:hypothetical protein [Nocardia zapadnayensis]MCX0269399.1 hypothetical protein [Nocardia zapadnayensis]
MWHWTTRDGRFPEALAFTRVTEPEPTITETVAESESEETDTVENEAMSAVSRPIGYDLAG